MNNKKWILKLHDDGEDPYFEITNGPISLCAACGFVGETDDDEDEIFKIVTDMLNESRIDFHSENKLEFDQHIQIQVLQSELHWHKEQEKKLADALEEMVKQFGVYGKSFLHDVAMSGAKKALLQCSDIRENVTK